MDCFAVIKERRIMVKANKIYYELSQERDWQVDAQERIRLLSLEILLISH